MSKILIYVLVAFFVIIFLIGYLLWQGLNAASAECEARYNMPCTILNAFRNSG